MASSKLVYLSAKGNGKGRGVVRKGRERRGMRERGGERKGGERRGGERKGGERRLVRGRAEREEGREEELGLERRSNLAPISRHELCSPSCQP